MLYSAHSLQRTISESNAGSQLQSTPNHHNQLLESDDEDGEEIEIVDEAQSEILNETGRDSDVGHEIHPDINLDTSGHSTASARNNLRLLVDSSTFEYSTNPLILTLTPLLTISFLNP